MNPLSSHPGAAIVTTDPRPVPNSVGCPSPDEGERLVEDEILAIDAAAHANHVSCRRGGDRRRDQRKVRALAADRPRPRVRPGGDKGHDQTHSEVRRITPPSRSG